MSVKQALVLFDVLGGSFFSGSVCRDANYYAALEALFLLRGLTI
jgi:hypothetical protein